MKHHTDTAAPETQLEAAHFALTGFNPTRTHRLAILHPDTGNFNAAQVIMAHDVDSVKGGLMEGDPWPFCGSLMIYTTPPPKETITRASRYWLRIGDELVCVIPGSRRDAKG